MEALVIGRHTNNLSEIKVVESRNVTFPATAVASAEVLIALIQECRERGLVLILQNTPTPVAAALAYIRQPMLVNQVRVGLVVSVPSEMPNEPQTKTFEVRTNGYDETAYSTILTPEAISEAVKFSNPRATVVHEFTDYEATLAVTVTVEQPRPFVFSHIEWL